MIKKMTKSKLSFWQGQITSKITTVIYWPTINKGYYMAARGYEFYLQVLKVTPMSE